MSLELTAEEILKEIKKCYKQYRISLKTKDKYRTGQYDGKLEVYEGLYKRAGGEYTALDQAKEDIDDMLRT